MHSRPAQPIWLFSNVSIYKYTRAIIVCFFSIVKNHLHYISPFRKNIDYLNTCFHPYAETYQLEAAKLKDQEAVQTRLTENLEKFTRERDEGRRYIARLGPIIDNLTLERASQIVSRASLDTQPETAEVPTASDGAIGRGGVGAGGSGVGGAG